MSKISENEEARLRRLYLSELAPGETRAAEWVDDSVRQVVRTANVRTGVRDVVVLALRGDGEAAHGCVQAVRTLVLSQGTQIGIHPGVHVEAIA